MPQAIQAFAIDQRRAIMQWLTQQGPFWEDTRKHGSADWLEVDGDVVTDTAVGEAGWCCLNGIDRSLVSIVPSRWMFSPIKVSLKAATFTQCGDVNNYWDSSTIESLFQALPPQFDSWSKGGRCCYCPMQ